MRLIDDAALDRVYVDLVRPLLFEELSASAAPELIMVGGQPGAGKLAKSSASSTASTADFGRLLCSVTCRSAVPASGSPIAFLREPVSRRPGRRQPTLLHPSHRRSQKRPIEMSFDVRRLQAPHGPFGAGSFDLSDDGGICCDNIENRTEYVNMSAVPLIVRVAVASVVYGRGSAEPTADEVGLPPVVSIDPEGFALARSTKITKIEQETTDDD